MSTRVLQSASRTATTAKGFAVRPGSVGVLVVVDVTDLESGTPSITVSLRAIDPASGQKINILTSAAISTVSTVTLRISPLLSAVANLTAQDIIAESMEVNVVHADGQAITYSVGALNA